MVTTIHERCFSILTAWIDSRHLKFIVFWKHCSSLEIYNGVWNPKRINPLINEQIRASIVLFNIRDCLIFSLTPLYSPSIHYCFWRPDSWFLCFSVCSIICVTIFASVSSVIVMFCLLLWFSKVLVLHLFCLFINLSC